MLVKVTAKVTGVNEQPKYYPEKGTYTLSTLSIIENPQQITGAITVPEKLEFGQICSIVVNTEEPLPVLQPTEREQAALNQPEVQPAAEVLEPI